MKRFPPIQTITPRFFIGVVKIVHLIHKAGSNCFLEVIEHFQQSVLFIF